MRQEPYTIVADAAVPAAAGLGDDASAGGGGRGIPIEARVTCAEIGSRTREAAVSVRTPAWVNVRIGTVSQLAEVCMAPARASVFARRLASLMEFVSPRLVVGAGRAWGADGRGRWTVFVGAGIAL